jgi:GxxExxY protein
VGTERTEIGEGMERTSSYVQVAIPPEWNGITEKVIGLAMTVHRELGPGLLERLYEDALCIEMELAGIRFQRQLAVRPSYKGSLLSEMRLDLLVEGFLVLELKSVSAVPDVQLAQLNSQLRAAGFPLGLLINFYNLRLKDNIYRRMNAAACPKHDQSLPSVPSVPTPSTLCSS